MTYPECPFCYSGEIVEDNNIKGNFFCNKCFKSVKIRTFDEARNDV